MISREAATQLLIQYRNDLENLHKMVTFSSAGLRSDAQAIPELIKVLESIANETTYEPTDYRTGMSSIGTISRDPQKALVDLVDHLDDRFINAYFSNSTKSALSELRNNPTLRQQIPEINFDALKSSIVQFRREVKHPIPSADLEKEALEQKSKSIASKLEAQVEFRVKDFNPHNPSHNARQPLETVQFEFRTQEERNAFYETVKQVDPSAIKYVGETETKTDTHGNPIPIVQVDPSLIPRMDSVLFPKENPLSKEQFIQTTRNLINAGIFSGRSSNLEMSLTIICEALETGNLIDGTEINAQISGGWMAANQHKTAEGMISADEAWTFLFQQMGELDDAGYKRVFRDRLEKHFSGTEYPPEVKHLWFDVFSEQEGYKENSKYANLNHFISDPPLHESTVTQSKIETPSPMSQSPNVTTHPTPPLPLTEVLKSIVSQTGNFSKYQTTAGLGQNIPFKSKPAQQFLNGLGVKNQIVPLSEKTDGKPVPGGGNPDVTVNSFDPKSEAQLVISGARIDRLRNSAKTYVNTDIVPKGHFKEIVASETLTEQTREKSYKTGVHLQNMAVGVCHVQEIDLLATPINLEGKAILGPRTGTINVDDPAILLLSTPALNLEYGTGKNLPKDLQELYIESMYRTLFHAAVSEGRQYIALPAAGLGVFGGDPETYFRSLMNVAKEFPQLNIIYNSGDPNNGPLFDEALRKHKAMNIMRTEKDVLIVAHELTQQGKPCAFHNPSDADVVLGIYDVGEYWKNGKGAGYVGEEHIGAMSTAPLNSKHLNPTAYENVVEHSFLPKPLYTDQHNAFIQHFIQHHSSGVIRPPLIREDKNVVQIEFRDGNYRDNFTQIYSQLKGVTTWEKNGKAYLTIPLNQIEALENGLLKKKYEHYATSNKENREVASVATCDNLNLSFKERYQQRQGDFLKSTIIKDFYEDLENADTPDEVKDVVARYKADGRYDILAKAQNTTMQVLGITTTSAKAFDELITERLNDIEAQKHAKAS